MRAPVITSNTPFGHVATFRGSSGLHADIGFLAELYREHGSLDAFQRVDPEKEVFWVPGDPRLVLRHNAGNGVDMPLTLEPLISHVAHAEDEFEHLRRLGIPMLRRTVHVIEKDPYNNGDSSCYTFVQRYGNGTTLADAMLRYETRSRAAKRLERISNAFINYYQSKRPGDAFLKDQGPDQHAVDGTQYDYDYYLSRDPEELEELLWNQEYDLKQARRARPS